MHSLRYRISSLQPWLMQLLIGIVLFAGYHLSFPANRSESDDGYMYARIVAQENPTAAELYDLKFVLFLPSAHGLFSLVRQIDPTADAYLLMCRISAVCAAMTLLIFYRLLHRQCGMSHTTALLGAGLLGISYHFWRYAVEAEVYLPAILAVTALFYLSMRSVNKGLSLPVAALIALLAGLAVLIYKPNMIPVGFLLLLLFTRKENRLLTIGAGALAALIIVAGYYQAYRLNHDEQIHFVQYLLTGTHSTHRVAWSTVKLVAVMGSLLLAPNFMYGFPAVQRFLQASFQGQYLQDEIFAASQFSVTIYAALLTLIACVIIFSAILVRSINKSTIRSFIQLPHLIVASWLLTYLVLLVVQLDSFSPEPFVPLLLPAVYLVTVVFFAPLADSPALPVAFVAATFCHNLLGGFSMVHSPTTEWLRCQQEWLIQNAQKGDVIVVHGAIVTQKKLAYYTPAQVLVSSVFNDPPFAVTDTVKSDGRIFLLTDVANLNRPGYQPTGDCKGHLYEVRRFTHR